MDKKIIIPLVLGAGAVALGIFVLTAPDPTAGSDAPTLEAGEESVEVTYSELGGEDLPAVTAEAGSKAPTASGAAAAVTAAALEARRDKALDSILKASTTYSPEGLKVLGPMLSDPDPEIREATIEGIVQLAETDGAKLLREAARSARNDQERRAMLEAAEFLELPRYEPPTVPVAGRK